MRVIGVVFGFVFGAPYMLMFSVIRLGDLWLSGNLRDAIAVPCDRASTHRLDRAGP